MNDIKNESVFATKPKKVATDILISLASFMVCFTGAELIFRIIAPTQPPGTTYGKPVAFNSSGFRDREYEKQRAANSYRILVLGDSFTWGVGLDVEETLPKLLEKKLDADCRPATVEVINASKAGQNTVEQLERLKQEGLTYDPDIVLLIYNLNDIEYLPSMAVTQYEYGKAVEVLEIDPGEKYAQYDAHTGIRGLIHAVERRSVFVRFLVPRVGSLLRRMGLLDSLEFSWVQKIYQGYSEDNPGWLEARRALTEIAALCREREMKLLVAVFPLLVELEDYKGAAAHETVTQTCEGLEIETVDLLPLFRGTHASSYWINFLDSHPNAKAHSMVAEHLAPQLLEILEKIELDRRK